ncbi:hypothetical protein CAJAP_04577 [Camponotus japonicus]
MKWILLLAIIPIIQYGEVAGYPPILKYLKDPTPIKDTPIKDTPADRNKLKCPEGNCDYCHLNDIIRAAYEASRKEGQQTDYMYPGYPGSSFDEAFEDIFPCRSARSPRVELTPYLTNSFDDNLSMIKTNLNILERNYKSVNEFLQTAEARKKEQRTGYMFEHHGSLFDEPIKDMIQSRSTRSTYLTNSFNDALARIRIMMGILESYYKYVNEDLKQARDSTKANSQKDKKDPSPSESIVSNNNIQENVTQTIPTPDESTNTQKPVPAKHDDKKDKLVGEKDPLHIPEIAPNNKTPENVRIIPVESTTIEKVESTTIKNDEKPE